MRKNLLLYGLQRSGTNYLKSLLEFNLQVSILNEKVRSRQSPLHNHFRLYDNKELIPEPKYQNTQTFDTYESYQQALNLKETLDGIIILSKHPIEWLISYKKWARDCNWPTPKHHYIHEYEAFYGKWLEFSKSDDRIIFVKYSDLINNLEEVMDCIQNHFAIQITESRAVEGKTINPKVVSQSPLYPIKRGFSYLTGGYFDQPEDTDLEYVKGVLDAELLNKLDYTI